MSDPRKGARIRATAATIVDSVVTGGRSLDAALAKHETRLAPEDRPLLRMLCYGTLRRHLRLQSWISTLVDRPLKRRDSVINALLAIGLFQLAETRIPDHAVVSQTVEASRLLRRPKLAGLLNAVLRRFLRENLAEADPATLEAKYEHPTWMLEAVRRDWPNHADAIFAANNARAPMWLRVNSARRSAQDYLELLADNGIEATELEAVPGALRLTGPVPVDGLPGFGEGVVSVQDAAAQLAAPWLLNGLEGRVLDACAAPGGKSAHLKELAGSGIDLTCVDKDTERLADIPANLDRLGLDATLVQGDASMPQEWWDGIAFDGILLDAPCSASGVIRRHPDIKVLRRHDDIGRLAELQREMLNALWALLSPGGRLLYVTCSVFAAENDEIVSAFLERKGDAREDDMLPNNNIRAVMQRKARGFQVLPGTADMDGFYFACLEKLD
jgi:16S rRNA (cytosine967-C5)-methyltransferase